MSRAAPVHYIDSHCHLDFPQFDGDRAAVLEQCKTLHVEQLILPGTTVPQWKGLLALTAQHNNLHAALGLHPLLIAEHGEDAVAQLEQALSTHPEVVALGEIGLDFTIDERGRQQALLEAQMEIARQRQLPLLLHVRKAHQQVIELLRTTAHNRGIVHAFSGSYEQAKLYIDQGFLLGFGGVTTRPNAHKLHRMIQQLPLEAIALETDAPDLPPIWAKGERNSPTQIPAITQHIATLRSESVEQIAQQTSRNVTTLLSLEY